MALLNFNVDPFGQRKKREAREDERALERSRLNREAIAQERQRASAQAIRQATGVVPFAPFDQQTASGQADTLARLGQGGPISQQIGARLGKQAFPEPPAIGAPSPKDFTVDSLAEFSRTGDINSLVRWDDPLAIRRVNQSDDRLILSQLLATRPPPAQVEKLIADQVSLDSLDTIIHRSDPGFFGLGFDKIAEARTAYGRRFGNEQEQDFIDFWREYNNWILEIRRQKFGTQFTPTEERVFNKLVAKPSDRYEAGMRNIQQQRAMVSRARLRRSSVLEEFGFDVPGLDKPLNGNDKSLNGNDEVIDRTTQ